MRTRETDPAISIGTHPAYYRRYGIFARSSRYRKSETNDTVDIRKHSRDSTFDILNLILRVKLIKKLSV